MATVKENKKDQLSDSIVFLAEQLKSSEDVFNHNITDAFDNISTNIYNSFRNEHDANVVDGLYAISESIDKLVRAIEQSK